MAIDQRVNFGKAVVKQGYGSTDTSIELESGQGAKFPDPASGEYNLVWWNATDYSDPSDDGNAEIVRVTAKTSDTLTITRAQEGTTAKTHNYVGKVYKVAQGVTKKMIDDIEADIQTDEEVQDLVGGMVTGNTETRIAVTYQDGDGTLDFVVDDDLANYSNTNSQFLANGDNVSDLTNDSGYITDISGFDTDDLTEGAGNKYLTGNEINDNVNGEINAITEKATPVNGDLVIIEDSAASYAKKKVQLGNLPGGGGGGGITWSEVTGTSQSASVNSGYITNNGSLVTVTLPSTASVGDIIRVVNKGDGGWKVAQNAGQTIEFDTDTTTSGTSGYLESNYVGDCVELVCITANNVFRVISSVGNINVN